MVATALFAVLFAVLFLTGEECPECLPAPTTVAPAWFTLLAAPLKSLAIAGEILDPREARYMLARPEDFRCDMRLLWNRAAELADAPPAGDAERWPERGWLNECLAFNRACRAQLAFRMTGDLPRWWALHEVAQETDRLYALWDTVRDARCEYYYVTVRRQALKRLRGMIGDAAYYRGELPPWVPVEYWEGN